MQQQSTSYQEKGLSFLYLNRNFTTTSVMNDSIATELNLPFFSFFLYISLFPRSTKEFYIWRLLLCVPLFTHLCVPLLHICVYHFLHICVYHFLHLFVSLFTHLCVPLFAHLCTTFYTFVCTTFYTFVCITFYTFVCITFYTFYFNFCK